MMAEEKTPLIDDDMAKTMSKFINGFLSSPQGDEFKKKLKQEQKTLKMLQKIDTPTLYWLEVTVKQILRDREKVSEVPHADETGGSVSEVGK